jgi:hypothetical protein
MPVVKSKPVSSGSREKDAVAEEREITYPTLTADVCIDATAITADDAKQLLGWQEETEAVKFGGAFMLKDSRDRKIRCHNNLKNRPLNLVNLQTLKQEHLRRRWRFNGEPIIVGKTGLLLNGQHTLISLVLAAQEWEDDREKWGEYWDAPPTMAKLVVSGVDESDEVVNTMDTCKPRALWEVIYRSEHFAHLKNHERKVCARMADYAVRLLWHRTGAGIDAFAPRRTHSESLGFVTRHPRLLEAIRHVYEENGDENCIGRYVSPGYAAGLCYLMGCSTTDSADYRSAAHPDESMLDWSQWDKACNFIVMLASGGNETEAVRKYLSERIELGGASNAERWAILANAWIAYDESGKIAKHDLELQINVTPGGSSVLTEHPTVGGIDLGDPSSADEAKIAAKDPSPEEIKARSKAVKEKAIKPTTPKKAGKFVPPNAGSKSGADWAEGDKAWVFAKDGDHYFGTLASDPYLCDDDVERTTVATEDGNEWEVDVINLRLERPSSSAKTKLKMPKARSSKQSTKAASTFKIGNSAWAIDRDGESWQGKIVEINDQLKVAKLRVVNGFQGAGNVRTVSLSDLQNSQPIN